MRSRERHGPSTGVRVVTWGVTALFALGMHLGIYLLVTRKDGGPIEAPAQPPAAVMINMAPIPMAAKSETDNAAEGPEAPDSKPAEMTEAEEAPPPPALDPLVVAPPPPPDVKPQAALPTTPPKKETKPPEKPIKKEIEKKDKPKKPVERKEKPQAASKSGGGPKSNRNDAVTAASAPGSAVSEVSRASWLGELRGKIVRAKRRPSDARGKFGVALVSVTFSANGVVSSARLVSSSGVPSLDAEAVAVMYRASPYPAPPGGKVTTISIPLNFN